MKRIYFILGFLISVFVSSAQVYPITQNIGSGNTLVRVPTPGGFQASLINRNFTDTITANLTPIKFYPGSQIYTTSDSSFWIRNPAANAWRSVGGGELFAVGDNLFSANRVTNMQNFRLNLDSGEVVIRGAFNSQSDSAFMVENGNGLPIIRVDNVAGKVNVLEFGAYNNSFFVNGAAAAIGNAYPFLFFNNAYLNPYQQALRIQKAYPLSNPFEVEKAAVIITNDTLNAKNSDSANYYPLIVKFKSFADNIERVRMLVNNEGSVYSARFNHDIAPDSVATITNGFFTYSTPSEIVSAGGGGGAGSAFTFQDSLQWIYSVAYGVVADGVTDNITALRSMRDAARSTGRPMLFAPGVITASDSVTFDHMVLVGHNTTIYTSSTSLTIFNLNDSCDVSGFTFTGTGKAASLPGGVFTLQNGIRVFGDANSIHNNRFISLNGSGVTLWGSSIFYNNRIQDNFFSTCTIGAFPMTNSEYTLITGNTFVDCYVNGYDRGSSNNQWIGNSMTYGDESNFRVLGNGDHGRFIGNTVNHGGTYNIHLESITFDYLIDGNDIYTGNIGLGTVDSTHDVQLSNNTIANATISGSRNVRTRFINNIYTNSVVESTTGVDYFNNLNSSGPVYVSTLTGGLTSAQLASMLTDETGTGASVFGTSPTFTTRATSPIITGSSSANGTLTLEGNNAGAGNTAGNSNIILRTGNTPTNALVINNAQEIGIGTNPATGFKMFIVSAGSGAGTTHWLSRNSATQNILFGTDRGDWRIGNQNVTTSVNNLVNRNFAGPTVSTPTAWMHLDAGLAAAGSAPLKFTSGTNLTTPEAGSVEFDGTNYFATASTTRYTIAKTLTNTATLDFPDTAPNTSSDLTITVTGLAGGEAVSVGVPNGSTAANSSYTAWVSAANTVTVRFLNSQAVGNINPASGTFRVSAIVY